MKALVIGLLTLCLICTFGAGATSLDTQATADIMRDGIIDYDYEDVPVEEINLSIDGNLNEIQPRQTFSISYTLNPWYTTTKQVYVDIFPQNAGEVTNIDLLNKTATIAVSEKAKVGTSISVVVSADNVSSNTVSIDIVKIPVENISLAVNGQAVLHKGRTNSVTATITPSYATNTAVRFELSGNGTEYIETFNSNTGEIKAKDNFDGFDVGATVTITAISLDNESLNNSVTLTIVIPTVEVNLSATTPRNALTQDNKPLAVVASDYADTVKLNTLVNGVASIGLNYVIVSGQEYIKNGAVKSDGTFDLKKTSEWTTQMQVPHAEVRIKVAYSDGFDEIIISLYVPVESYSFDNVVPSNVENFRNYDLKATAYPYYATFLADNNGKLTYSLNGIASEIATVDEHGLVTLPKSLTSKNSVINYSVCVDGWVNVDADKLQHQLKILPVYGTSFDKVMITKDGREIDPYDNRVICDDILDVVVVFDKDNVTELHIDLYENSNMISIKNNRFVVTDLSGITDNNPIINVKISYSQGGNEYSAEKSITIYVPAKFATIGDTVFNRGVSVDLNTLITINGHNFASNKTIEWGTPIVNTVNGQAGITAILSKGVLSVSSQANAGTVVSVPYRTCDGDWQSKQYTVVGLDDKMFKLSYGLDDTSGRNYTIDPANPQLEEGFSIELYIKYAGFDFNGLGGNKNYGLEYRVNSISSNATLSLKNQLGLHDAFGLAAKAGEKGKDNNITYRIDILDGNLTYTVSTDNNFAKPIAIFNRISGNISVSNNKIVCGDTFTVKNWDSLATFDNTKLIWRIANKDLADAKMIDFTASFAIEIKAVQSYNNSEIIWSTIIGYSLIIYKDGDTVIRYVGKKNGASVSIENASIYSKQNYTMTGWATDSRADKKSKYVFNYSYSGDNELTLWACWITSPGVNTIATINYNGSDNKCNYDLRFGSSSVDGNNYNRSDAYVEMVGVSCIRKGLTTFHYMVKFTLFRNDTNLATKTIDFKIADKDDVPGNKHQVFTQGNFILTGDYHITWDVVIQSNVKSEFSGSYYFRINSN